MSRSEAKKKTTSESKRSNKTTREINMLLFTLTMATSSWESSVNKEGMSQKSRRMSSISTRLSISTTTLCQFKDLQIPSAHAHLLMTIEFLSSCFITSIELIGILSTTTLKGLSRERHSLKSWCALQRTSHTRVSTTLMITRSTLSTDKERRLSFTVTMLRLLSSKKWLIKILVRCILSTTRPLLPDLPVKSYSSKLLKRKMRMTQARRLSSGNSTTSSMLEASFTSSKVTRESR